MKHALLAVVLTVSASASAAMCFAEAAQRYGVSRDLLVAIARVESDMRPDAVNCAHQVRTGSCDLGLMQINTRHLPRLASFGIDRQMLLDDPCVNVMVGAWILADNFARLGPGWEAVGAYNASCTELRGAACVRARTRYAWRVHDRLRAASAVDQEARPAARRLVVTSVAPVSEAKEPYQ